jgi:hypothetical protein
MLRSAQSEIEKYETVFLVVDALDEASTETCEFLEGDIRTIIPKKLRMLSMKRQIEEIDGDQGIMTCSNCGADGIEVCYHCMDDTEDKSHFDLCEDCHAKGIPCPRDPSHVPYLPLDLEVAICVPDDVLKTWVISKMTGGLILGGSRVITIPPY